MVLALAGVIYWSSQRSSDSAAREFSQKVVLNLVERVSQTAETHLMGARTAIAAVAPDPVYSPADGSTNTLPFSEDSADIEQRLWIATGFFPTAAEHYVFFGGADGRFIGINRRATQIELRLRPPGAAQRSIYSVAAPGKLLGLLRTDAYDPRTRPWFREAVASGHEQWSRVYVDFTTIEPVLTLSKPIYRADRSLVGVVSTDLSLTGLTRFFQSLSVSPNGIAFMVERSGAIIATSTNELPFRAGKTEPLRLLPAQSTSALLRQSYEEVMGWQRDGENLSHPVSRSFDTVQGTIQVGATYLRDPNGLEWITVVAAPRADFTSNVTGVMYQSLGIGLVAVAILTVMGYMLLQWVLRDIRKLTRAVERIDRGQPSEPLDIVRGDEIGMLAKSFREMERNLRLDALTGALNREMLLAQIRFRQRAATEFLPLQYALLFLDLDRFKPINDEYGHDTGDRALIEITARLTSSLRAHDEVARFGGDEFVVYLHDVSSDDNLQAIRSKIAALLDAPLALREDLSVSIGASIGWAIYPTDGADVDTILRVADGRMFEIKKARKQV